MITPRLHALLGGMNPNVSGVYVHLRAELDDIAACPQPIDTVMRELSPSDAMDWRRVTSAAYGETQPQTSLAQINANDRVFKDLTTYGAFGVNGDLRGVVSVGTYHSAPDVLGVRRLAVDRSMQGHGIASWLMTQSLLEAPPARHVELVVKVTRARALSMYAHLGFTLMTDWSDTVDIGQRRLPLARSIALRRARRSMAGNHA